ncbi:MAG: DUF4982 domain-containing protein [Muribaculaceae bacterium]|nr:DUF4982 domain-containing protein [Muribaculaceae bacterium]
MKKIKLFLLILMAGLFGNLAQAVDNENNSKTYILGHWDYPKDSVQPVYVMSEGDDVELFINDIPFGHGKRASDYLFIFDNVIFQPGTLTAVGYDWQGKELSRHSVITPGVPAQLVLTPVGNQDDFHANGEDLALFQVEVGDFQARRCNDNRIIRLEIEGPAEWLGSFPSLPDNSINNKKIQAVNGMNRFLVKSTHEAGPIKITAHAEGLAPVTFTLNSLPAE